MPSTISLCKVSKHYGSNSRAVTAIRDFTMKAESGEFISILGPSGCGKSTILNLIAGFIPPSAGQIYIDERTVSGPGPDRVLVTQESSLFTWKTAQQNVEFGLKARHLPAAASRAAARKYLELVRLSDFWDRYPRELSGGMCQRLAFARALAVEPGCLLLDEPWASLDITTRQELHDVLLCLWARTRPTIVLVTHDVDEALYLSDRIYTLSHRPGTITKDFLVPLLRPRLPEMRATTAFCTARAELSKSVALLPAARAE